MYVHSRWRCWEEEEKEGKKERGRIHILPLSFVAYEFLESKADAEAQLRSAQKLGLICTTRSSGNGRSERAVVRNDNRINFAANLSTFHFASWT